MRSAFLPRLAAVVIVACGVFGASGSAWSARPDLSAEDKTRLRQLVEDADRARQAGSFDEAIDKLRAALTILPDAGLVCNLARTYEDAEQYQNAKDHYELCLRRGPAPEFRRLAEDHLPRVMAALSKGRLVLDVVPAGAAVVVDGVARGRAPLEPMELTAGRHMVRVDWGFISDVRSVDVPGAGEARAVFTRLGASDPERESDEGLEAVVGASADGAPDDRARLFSLSLSASEGLAFFEQEPYRTHIGLELTPALRFSWLRVEVATSLVVEPPVAVLLRPGLRFDVGPVYLRAALQVAVTPDVLVGWLAGLGRDLPIGRGWALFAELDGGMLTGAVGTVEARVGAAYGF